MIKNDFSHCYIYSIQTQNTYYLSSTKAPDSSLSRLASNFSWNIALTHTDAACQNKKRVKRLRIELVCRSIVHQACQNRFGNDFRLWLSMVLHNWLCNSQLYLDPSSFLSYSMIFQPSIYHLLCIKDEFLTSGERGSVLELLLCMREVPDSIPGHGTSFQFWYKQ